MQCGQLNSIYFCAIYILFCCFSGVSSGMDIIYSKTLKSLFNSKLVHFFTVFFIACAHVIFALQLTSYLRTIFTTHKPIPEQVSYIHCMHIFKALRHLPIINTVLLEYFADEKPLRMNQISRKIDLLLQ